jgi:methyltransferase-like protein
MIFQKHQYCHYLSDRKFRQIIISILGGENLPFMNLEKLYEHITLPCNIIGEENIK